MLEEFQAEIELTIVLTFEEARFHCPAVAQMEQKNIALTRRVEELQRQVDWLTRQLWGAKSEKRALATLTLGQQFWLGQELEPLEVPMDAPPPETTVKSYERKQRSRKTEPAVEDSQLKFTKDVPVEVIEVEDPSTSTIPEEQRVLVSEQSTYRLAQRSPYVVLEYRTKTYKHKESGKLVTPRLPEAVIIGSSADVSFLAGMLVDKFHHHLPLYRQHERLEKAGVLIDRGTLTRQVHRTLELLEPVYHALMSSTLQSKILAVDESPTPAGLQRGAGKQKGKMHNGYFWSFYGSNDEVFFLYSPGRARKVLDAALEGFQGTLMSDGYVAYESFAKAHPGVLHAQCWAHSRRNFINAEKAEPKRCEEVLLVFQQLYGVERQADLGSEQLLELRQKRSKPMVDALFTYLEKQIAESIFLPSNSFHKAAQYMLDRREELQVFLERPDVPLDTNHVERSIRPTVVGRKNWLFNFTEGGARYAAIAYSLIQSCVAADINPTTYLIDVLQRIATHPALEVHLLTPRLWKQHFASAPLTSPPR